MKKISKVLNIAILTVGIATSFAWADEYNFSQNLYKTGMEHKDIKIIQEALKKDGSFTYGDTTTYFGEITKQAVVSYQKKNNLKADGIVGQGTLEKMNQQELILSSKDSKKYKLSQALYKKGMTHNDIKIIQEIFEKDGVYNFDKLTTYFGTETEKATKAFQKKYGLVIDGIVGNGTLNQMRSMGLISADTTTISRGTTSGRKIGKYLDWFKEVRGKIVNRQDVLLVEDFETGKTFKVKVTAGTNHADVETLTLNDTNTMKKVWGGFSWARRPVLVYKDDMIIAASMTNMPHAGVESKPGGETVSNRSDGYGTGYNYDFIKKNGMDGHVDLHFNNSRRHMDNKEDSNHQKAVKKAAGK